MAQTLTRPYRGTQVQMIERLLGRERARQQEFERALRAEWERIHQVQETLAQLMAKASALTPFPATMTASLNTIAMPSTYSWGTSPPSFVEAAQRALFDKGGAMRTSELVKAIQAQGVGGNRPFEEVRASVTPALRRRTDLFRCLRRGVYELADTDKKKRSRK